MSQKFAALVVFPVPVLDEIVWRGLVSLVLIAELVQGNRVFGTVTHLGSQEEELGWERGEIQHAFGVFSRPLAENENTRRDGGDFIL